MYESWRCIPIAFRELDINDDIRDSEVRLIDHNGEQRGVVPIAQARALALENNLDLVKIAPQATPPVCRIMDYGKHRFEQQKREKEARKNQKIVELKEIRLSMNIDTHDFDTKLVHARRFLQEGNKIKASIRFRGREMAHASQGTNVMKRFAEALEEHANIEKKPVLDGRSMQMILAPKVTK